MRLIDADSVLKGIDELKKSPWYNFGKEIGVDPFAHVGFLARREAIGVVVDLCIKKEPTIQQDAPRVMTLEEIESIGAEDVCGFIEVKEEEHMYGCYMRRYDEAHTELMSDVPNLPKKLQNGYVRIWTARPTDEQRKAVKWDAVD